MRLIDVYNFKWKHSGRCEKHVLLFVIYLILPNRKLNIYRMESLQFKGLGTFMKPFQAFY